MRAKERESREETGWRATEENVTGKEECEEGGDARGRWEEGEEEEEEVHQVLLSTVEEPSGWRSPPLQRPSAQTQTGPAGETKEEGRERAEEEERYRETQLKDESPVRFQQQTLPKDPPAT